MYQIIGTYRLKKRAKFLETYALSKRFDFRSMTNVKGTYNDQCETVERATKRRKIGERQSQYNEQMVKQIRKLRKAPFKIDDVVAIKIDRVDKTSPVHPNMLLGKIMEIRKDYAKIVTPQGIIKGFISFSRFYPCTSRNMTLDYCKENFVHSCLQAS